MRLLLRIISSAIALAGLPCHGATAVPEIITTAAVIEELPPARAREAIPVKLDAVIVYLRSPGLPKFVLQDESGGVTAEADDPGILLGRSLGERVEAIGVTDGVRRGNIFRVSSLRVLGKPGFPVPQESTVAELVEGEPTGGLYEITGTVRSVREETEISPSRLILGIGPSRLRLNIWVANFEGHENDWPPDTVIRVKGVMQRWRSESGQPYTTFLLANEPGHIEIVSPAPSDPWEAKLLPLYRFRIPPAGDAASRRQRVQGIVTWQLPGRQIILQNQGRGLQIDLNEELDLQIGDEIEVIGFPSPGSYNGKLEDVTVRKTGNGRLPDPIALEDIDITQRRPDGLGHDALRVLIRGTLAAIYSQDEGLTLDLECSGRRIPCILPGEAMLPPGIRPGCELSVVGVSRLELSDRARQLGYTADSMKLGVAGVSDLTLLKAAPWWTAGRLRTLLFTIAGALGILALWSFSLRRKNLRLVAAIDARTRAERQLAHERHRVAADLHDTLEQTLLGAELQLTAASRTLGSRPEATAGYLGLAHQLLKRSRLEVRETVWDLHRAGDLSSHGFIHALEELRRDHKVPGGPEITLEIAGKPQPIPGLIVTHLTRAARESITNAVKHGNAGKIRMHLGFEPDRLVLAIEDNGRGFDMERAPGPRDGHFGVAGLRERAERLEGSFSLDSSPGSGTRLFFEIPLASAALPA